MTGNLTGDKILGGFSRKQLTRRLILSPNEGIRRSRKNGLLLLTGGLSAGLVLGLTIAPSLGWGLALGLVFGLLSGLFLGTNGGLGATVQHYILRFWLWQAKSTPIPWRYVAFLDDAVEQQLLRKVGGGYVYRHRLLQDYFASLEINRPPDRKTDQASQIPLSPEEL